MFKVVVPVYLENTNKEEVLKMLKEVEADSVALVLMREIDYSFSSPESLLCLDEYVKFFRAEGYRIIVWIGQTLGHDTASDATPRFTSIRCIDSDAENGAVFCPLDNGFAESFESWIKDIAKCAPDVILLDDDFRQSYRGQGLGCCCDLHMEKLCNSLGEKIERSELRERIFGGGKNKYRDAWLSLQRSTMTDFAKRLRTSLDSVDKTIRMGFCLSPCSFDHDMDALEVARAFAGDTVPFVRTLGAPYWATKERRRHLGEMINLERMEIEWCREVGIESIAEGDNFPRPRFATPAAYVEVFEQILRADGKNDGILKYYVGSDPFDYERGYINAAKRNMPLNKEIEKLFADKTHTLGINLCNFRNLLDNAEIDASEAGVISKWERELYYPSLDFATVTSMPSTFGGDGINIIFGENARYITRDALKQGNVIDIAAARILTERGIDVGIQGLDMTQSVGVKGTFASIQECKTDEESGVLLRGDVPVYLPKHKDGVRFVSRMNINGEFYCGVYEYENAEGERFLVYPFDADRARHAKNWFDSYMRREQLLDSCEFLSGKPFAVRDMGRHPMLYMLAKDNEHATAVGVWNIFEDAVDDAVFEVQCEFSEARFVNCEGHTDGKRVFIDSIIQPFAFAGFELKK